LSTFAPSLTPVASIFLFIAVAFVHSTCFFAGSGTRSHSDRQICHGP
jgi:hypothetical protein